MITEWKSDPLEPKMVFRDEDQVSDTTVVAECIEANEVAIHALVGDPNVSSPLSLYLTPSQAVLFAERIRTAAWIAEAQAEEAAV